MDQDVKCKVREKRNEKPKADMQEHPAHAATTIIPRTFRWTLVSESHPDIHWWMKSIQTKYVEKRIIIEVLDDAKGVVFNWLQTLTNRKEPHSVILSHLDHDGEAISVINFSGLKLEDHLTPYDYKSSEVLTHKAIMTYDKVERNNKQKTS